MEDAKILDLYFARDEDAIRETDTAYGKRLHTLAKNILQNREDAEESVNDTYAEVWKSIPPRRPKYFFAFLASICRHLSLNRVDWKQAAKRRAQDVPLPAVAEVADNGFAQPGEEAGDDVQVKAVGSVELGKPFLIGLGAGGLSQLHCHCLCKGAGQAAGLISGKSAKGQSPDFPAAVLVC